MTKIWNALIDHTKFNNANINCVRKFTKICESKSSQIVDLNKIKNIQTFSSLLDDAFLLFEQDHINASMFYEVVDASEYNIPKWNYQERMHDRFWRIHCKSVSLKCLESI